MEDFCESLFVYACSFAILQYHLDMSELTRFGVELSQDERRSHLIDLLEDFVRQTGGYAPQTIHTDGLFNRDLMLHGTVDEFCGAASAGEQEGVFVTGDHDVDGFYIQIAQ